MRVISGALRGRRLREPAGMGIRPTSDMVKESVFNIIQFDIEGRRVLDLFAGTGQLGIEALSRGAASAVFVDESARAVRLVRENVQLCGVRERAEVIQGGALQYIRGCGRFDLIFLDPPYDTRLLDEAVAGAVEFDILKENGIMVCETKAHGRVTGLRGPYALAREYRYGGVKISVIRRAAE